MSKESEDYLEKIDCENTNYLLHGQQISLAEILDNYCTQQLKILNIPDVSNCADDIPNYQPIDESVKGWPDVIDE